MIIFKKIRFKNILSVGNMWQEIQLDKAPQALMVGLNGSGKSTLLDALIFVLYGKAFRKIRLDQLVNSINRGGLIVELEFSIGNTDYEVRRGVKPDVFEIFVNGDLKKMEAAKKDYQKHLENNILKMSPSTFKQIVILGSTSYVPFMRLVREERRNIIGDLLDIQVFTYMNQIIRLRENALNKEYTDVQNLIRNLATQADLIKEHIDKVKLQTSQNKKQLQKKLTRAKTDITECEMEITDALYSISLIKPEVSGKAKLDEREGKFRTLKTTILANKRVHQTSLDFFKDNDTCPSCDQDIASDLKAEKISTHTDKITELETGVDKIKDEMDSVKQRLLAVTARMNEITGFQSVIQTNRQTVESKNESVKDLEKQLKTDTSSVNISADEDKLVAMATEMKSKQADRNELSVKGQYYSAMLDMLKDSGIKTAIIKSYLPIINKLVRKYLDILDFNVDFRFDEEFNEVMKSRYRDNFSYANFSEGEKMRIDLALLFVWRELARMRNSAATNLLILDEIGDSSLDADGFEAFMKIISESGKQQNTFIISHKVDIMIDKFTTVYQFEKVNDFSEMEQ